MIKLKDDVDLKYLNKFGIFEERTVINGIDDVPEYLKWWSYWRNIPRTGFVEAIEINMGSREIRCQGCLDILMDMIEDGIVEKMPIDGGYTYATSNLEEEF